MAETSRTALRLVETQTGTTLAHLECPTIQVAASVAFSPDGSKLVVSTEDKPAVHVWDLRMIRRHLVGMGLDWKAPAYSEDDAASPSRPPLPALEIDYGKLAGHVDVYRTPWSVLYDRSTAEINKNPHDDEAYHHRAHAQAGMDRIREAIGDISQRSSCVPTMPIIDSCARYLYIAGDFPHVIADLEHALAARPDQVLAREFLAIVCCLELSIIAPSLGPSLHSSVAWHLVAGPSSSSRTPDSTGTFSASLCCARSLPRGDRCTSTELQKRSLADGRIDVFHSRHRSAPSGRSRPRRENLDRGVHGSGLSEGSTQRGNKRLAATKEKPRHCSPALLPSCRKTFSHTGPGAGSPAFA